jgi:hypothetical protein
MQSEIMAKKQVKKQVKKKVKVVKQAPLIKTCKRAKKTKTKKYIPQPELITFYSSMLFLGIVLPEKIS